MKNEIVGLHFNEQDRPSFIILQSDKYYEENKAGNRIVNDKW